MKRFFLQTAYMFLALPFFLGNILYIRYALEFAFLSFILWDIHNGSRDYTTLIWNSIFLGINTYLIIIELQQYNWVIFPTDPIDDLGKIYNVKQK